MAQEVPILKRAIDLLDAIADQRKVNAKSLWMDLGMPSATCYRLLNTFCEKGWLVKEADGDYRVAFSLSRMGDVASRMARVIAQLRAPLEDLSGATGMGAKVSVRQALQALVIARYDPPSRKPLLSGAYHPIQDGSTGAVFLWSVGREERRHLLTLADSQRERLERQFRELEKTGAASDHGETAPDILSLSCPLPLPDLDQSGALTLYGSLEPLDSDRLTQRRNMLLKAAGNLGRGLSGPSSSPSSA